MSDPSATGPTAPAAPDRESSGLGLGFLAALGPAEMRALLPGFLAGYLDGAAASASNRARMAAFVGTWSDDDCRALIAHLGTLGQEHRLYTASPQMRALSREWTRDVVTEAHLEGVEHLRDALAAGPTLVACNHTSYMDTNASDAVLAWNGAADLADRLVALAGPKVYADLFRILAAGCLNNLPVPQSTSFTHTEKLSPRELARRAHASLESAAGALNDGFALLLYPEGSRTRSGRLGPFLRATHRYVSCVPEVRVVPVAVAGVDRIMPVNDKRVHPGPVRLSFAPPLRVGTHGTAREVLELAHAAVEGLLPPAARPEPGAPRLA